MSQSRKIKIMLATSGNVTHIQWGRPTVSRLRYGNGKWFPFAAPGNPTAKPSGPGACVIVTALHYSPTVMGVPETAAKHKPSRADRIVWAKPTVVYT